MDEQEQKVRFNLVNSVVRELENNPDHWSRGIDRLSHISGDLCINLVDFYPGMKPYDLFLGNGRIILDDFSCRRIHSAVKKWQHAMIRKNY